MRKISKNAQKIFNHAKANPRLSVYELAAAVGINYKNAHVAVAFCEKLGFVKSELSVMNNKPRREVFVIPELQDLDISEVVLESGDKLIDAKAANRKWFFQRHGSMAVMPMLNVELAIENESFDKW